MAMTSMADGSRTLPRDRTTDKNLTVNGCHSNWPMNYENVSYLDSLCKQTEHNNNNTEKADCPIEPT